MKEKEFKELLEQIENGTFIGDTIKISGAGLEESSRLPEAFRDNNIIELANTLQKNPNITKLVLPEHYIGDRGAIAISSVTTLEEVDLWGNSIRAKGATALGRSNLKKLNLSDNFIAYEQTAEDIIAMTEAFASNQTIINLQLDNCQIPDEMVAVIIKNNKTIIKLDVSSCELSDECLKHIKDNTTLKSLCLYGNEISDEGSCYISQNSSLIEIVFGDKTSLTEIAAKYLSTHLTLKSISLNGTLLTMADLLDLQDHLSKGSELEALGEDVDNIDYY